MTRTHFDNVHMPDLSTTNRHEMWSRIGSEFVACVTRKGATPQQRQEADGVTYL